MYEPLTPEEHAFMLKRHLPPGRLLASAFDADSNLSKLLSALSFELYRDDLLISDVMSDFDFDHCDTMLENWEKSLSIPNSYFLTAGKSTLIRQLQAKSLFSNFEGAQTHDDFIRISEMFGYGVTIQTGCEYYGSVSLITTHQIVITIISTDLTPSFPYDFPVGFELGGSTFLQNLFEQLVPANVEVVIME